MVTRQAWEQGEGTISQWDAHPHSGHLYCACASLFPGCCQATAPISLAVRSVLSSWWLVQSEGPPAVLLLPGLLPEWWPLACAPLGHRQLRSNCNPPFGDIGSIALRTGRGLLGWACFLGSLVFLALVTAPFTGLCCFRSSCSSEHWACPIQPAAVQCLFTTLHQRCSCPSAARSVQAEPELALHLSTQPVNPRMFRCPERR
ncbi:uncharacterized protein LOC144176013 isoform X5 [Haemaphysalis longicornis]